MVMKSKGAKQERRQQPWMPVVKEATKGKDRAATRQLLHHGQYDDIPKHRRVKTEDPWVWD
jgi:hypothetical protein